MSEDPNKNLWRAHGPGIYSIEVRPRSKKKIKSILRQWSKAAGLKEQFDQLHETVRVARAADVEKAGV